MEVLANTEYQDVYRIVDGVLLIVNKFKRIIYDDDEYFRVSFSESKVKSYNKGCQKWLKVLKEDYCDAYSNITVPKGTVLYQDYPIKSTKNPENYAYEIKTTSNAFGGSYSEVMDMIKSIREVMDGNNFADESCMRDEKIWNCGG